MVMNGTKIIGMAWKLFLASKKTKGLSTMVCHLLLSRIWSKRRYIIYPLILNNNSDYPIDQG